MNQRGRSSSIPILLIIGGALLLVVAALLLIPRSSTTNQASPDTFPTDSHVEETYPEIPRISLEDSKAAFDDKSAVFLDVRDAGSYAVSHIPGAVNIPSGEIPTRLDEIDRDVWIITYCT
jgi:3-mercaptopyruvate sulfurtransferase SseA